MKKKLIEIMQLYFKAGKELNLEVMDKLYANDFENIRMDKAGQIIRIYKTQFMERFQIMKAKGLTHGTGDDIEIIGTSFYDNRVRYWFGETRMNNLRCIILFGELMKEIQKSLYVNLRLKKIYRN